jgi:transposase-like protein
VLFKGCHFDREIITLSVRWYVTYKLSYRNLAEMMAERHLDMAHTTILRGVLRYVPEFVKQWWCYVRSVGTFWRVAETYIKIKGNWVYLYLGVDTEGQTINFFLSERRSIAAATPFLQQAIEKRGLPQKITLDGSAASRRAVAELREENLLPATLIVRTNRYLNHVIEQDHRRVKRRVRPMLGFTCVGHGAIIISGIEFVHQLRKGQCALSALCPPGQEFHRSGRQCWLPTSQLCACFPSPQAPICTKTFHRAESGERGHATGARS